MLDESGPTAEHRTMPRAVVTGTPGEDGRFLAELLNEKDYEVFGLMKARTTPETRARP